MINKILLFSFIVFLNSSNADYLNTTNNYCIYNVAPYTGSSGLCYISRFDSLSYCSDSLTYDLIIDGYQDINGTCLLKDHLSSTGLTQNQFDYLSYVQGNFIGFVFLFFITLLISLSQRGR